MFETGPPVVGMRHRVRHRRRKFPQLRRDFQGCEWKADETAAEGRTSRWLTAVGSSSFTQLRHASGPAATPRHGNASTHTHTRRTYIHIHSEAASHPLLENLPGAQLVCLLRRTCTENMAVTAPAALASCGDAVVQSLGRSAGTLTVLEVGYSARHSDRTHQTIELSLSVRTPNHPVTATLPEQLLCVVNWKHHLPRLDDGISNDGKFQTWGLFVSRLMNQPNRRRKQCSDGCNHPPWIDCTPTTQCPHMAPMVARATPNSGPWRD
jgi:hypothetical protein